MNLAVFEEYLKKMPISAELDPITAYRFQTEADLIAGEPSIYSSESTHMRSKRLLKCTYFITQLPFRCIHLYVTMT